MRITSKGQVTIPADIRVRAGLLPDTEVTFTYDGTSVQLIPATDVSNSRGARLVAHMRGRAKGGMTTDELMALSRGEE